MRDDLTIQIIGTRKDAATRRALRYFAERGLKAHLVDLHERGLTRGELENMTRRIDPIELIDSESEAYRKGGFAYLDFDPIDELIDKPLLLKMPVVRCGGRVTVGEAPDQWKLWLEA